MSLDQAIRIAILEAFNLESVSFKDHDEALRLLGQTNKTKEYQDLKHKIRDELQEQYKIKIVFYYEK